MLFGRKYLQGETTRSYMSHEIPMKNAENIAFFIGILYYIKNNIILRGDHLIRRSIVNDLISWKDSKRRKPLLLTGVRQCGKTYTVKEFGREYFKNTVYINFEAQSSLGTIFDHDLDVKRIIGEIELMTGERIHIGSTLLFLDEIQSCPSAITALKYFCEDMRELHIIAAGSLLGVALNRENISFPVGKINRLTMYPVNFYEFAVAEGYENILKLLSEWEFSREIPEQYMHIFTKTLKEYFIVGGMPEAVDSYLTDRDFGEVDDIQGEILTDYADDFSKYTTPIEAEKIRWIWNSVPVQLAKENNKFIFSHVKAGKRAKDLEDSLNWLNDSGLVRKLELVENPEHPLSGMADTTYFKLYMSDVGLLRKRAGLSPLVILNESGNYIEFKGALTENFVMNELVMMGKEPFFWRSSNTAELDFIYEDGENIVPVEVKSADNVMAKSYRNYCRKYNPNIGYKLSLKNMAENMCGNTRTVNLPLFMIWRLGGNK